MITVTWMVLAVAIASTDAGSLLNAEQGWCLTKDGTDQNSGTSHLTNPTNKRECLLACLNFPKATGCEWSASEICTVHTKEVDHGSGNAGSSCWVFSKCQADAEHRKLRELIIRQSKVLGNQIREEHQELREVISKQSKELSELREIISKLSTGLAKQISEQFRSFRVDGKWNLWSSWGDCSKSCGGGTENRTRSCNNPAPNYGGKYCSGPSTERQGCNDQKCPEPFIYYPPGSTDHRAKKYYKKYGLHLIGRGAYGKMTGSIGYNRRNTIEECFDTCQARRNQYGVSWNGVSFIWSEKRCECYQNDKGHQEIGHYLHYRWE